MDRRTRKTRQAIIKSFLDLKKSKDISKISIAEIAERADIGRGTFYTHYRDIYDLEESIVSDFLNNIQDIIQTSYANEEDFNVYVIILCRIIDLIEEQKEFCKDLLSLNSSVNFTQRLTKELTSIVLIEENSTSNSQEQIELVLFVSGWATVLSEWLLGNINMSADSLKEMIITIYQEMFE